MKSHVVVVGAGIIGSMVAVKLLDLGAQVTLLDAGFAGQATRSSGGMLAPTSEALSIPESWREKAVQSLHLWQDWLKRFEQMGVDVGYQTGLGHAACSAEEALNLKSSGEWLEDHPLHPYGMAYFPQEGSLEPEKVLSALHMLCPVTHAEVHAIEDQQGLVVRTSLGELRADALILACGAWSAKFGIPVLPKQGQVLLIEGKHIEHATYKAKGYLVPRGNRTFVGATEIETLDVRPTQGAKNTLLNHVRNHHPHIPDPLVLEHRVGVRPYLPEPFVGHHPTLKGVLVATGHHRNGVLLAPVTAQLLAELFMEASPDSYGLPVH